MAVNETAPNDMAPNDDVLGRAARELRDEEQPGWIDVSTSIIDRVRATARRSWPLDALFPDATVPEAAGTDTLQVADHVVRMAIATALQERTDTRVRQVDLAIDGHACTGAAVEVAATYGADIPALAADLVERTLAVFDHVLGGSTSARTVTVHVADLIAPAE